MWILEKQIEYRSFKNWSKSNSWRQGNNTCCASCKSIWSLKNIHERSGSWDWKYYQRNQDDPLLTVRYVKGKNPIRIILDSNGTIKNDSRIIKTSKRIPTIIIVSEIITKSNLNRLQKLPIDVIVCGKNQVNIVKLLSILSKKGIKTILLEGGGTLNRSFLKKNLIDEMIITLTPYILQVDWFVLQ